MDRKYLRCCRICFQILPCLVYWYYLLTSIYPRRDGNSAICDKSVRFRNLAVVRGYCVSLTDFVNLFYRGPIMGNFGSCVDNINIPPCVWFAGGEKRNAVASMVAGALVSDIWSVTVLAKYELSIFVFDECCRSLTSYSSYTKSVIWI